MIVKSVWLVCWSFAVLLSCWSNPGSILADEPARKAVPVAAREESLPLQQFRGLVEAGRRVRFDLLPGEKVQEVMVAKNDRVKKGTPLFRLSNEALVGALAGLLEKQTGYQEIKQQMSLLNLEIGHREEALKRLDAKIAAETKLAREVPGYVATRAEALREQRLGIESELDLLKARVPLLKEKSEQGREMEALLSREIALLKRQIQRLVVTAPFDGQVVYVNSQTERLPPGGPVCELWDDSFLLVRGQVMQHQLKHVTPGSKVLISLDFTQEKPVAGEVTSVEKAYERIQAGAYPTFQVLIKIAGKVDWLEPGMTVSVKLNGPPGQVRTRP